MRLRLLHAPMTDPPPPANMTTTVLRTDLDRGATGTSTTGLVQNIADPPLPPNAARAVKAAVATATAMTVGTSTTGGVMLTTILDITGTTVLVVGPPLVITPPGTRVTPTTGVSSTGTALTALIPRERSRRRHPRPLRPTPLPPP